MPKLVDDVEVMTGMQHRRRYSVDRIDPAKGSTLIAKQPRRDPSSIPMLNPDRSRSGVFAIYVSSQSLKAASEPNRTHTHREMSNCLARRRSLSLLRRRY
jgi:hypothetical protein